MNIKSVLVLFSLSVSTNVYANNERIVSAGAGVTEILFALGAGKQIVAVDSTSRVPNGVKLPILGYHRALSAEGVLSVKPTLVIGSDEMGPDQVVKQLQRTKTKVVILKSENKPENLSEQILKIGQIVGQEENAKKLVRKVNQDIKDLRTQNYARSQSAIFLMMQKGKSPMAGGGDTPVQAMMALLNAKNLAYNLKSYQNFSYEMILQQNPKVILLAKRSFNGNMAELKKNYPLMVNTQAYKNNCIFAIDGKAITAGVSLGTISESKRVGQLIRNNPKCLG
ncbi:heme/hemin ABC transporter substrate-binding protein [Neisseria sp. Ec49-e6-T10]|uniref:heme/hemin ABC transporter substrate-binding protein n=1 Tax=Neisseria sp. Ec49-e6-T10 TaxID=3140744 RepID=UPI003EB7DC94